MSEQPPSAPSTSSVDVVSEAERERWQRVSDIVADALEIADPARRRAFVEAACGDDSALNAEVGQFLRLADSDAHTLERTQVAQQVRDALAQGLGPDGADKPEVAWIGRRLGAWEIVAEIARGGMGAVYLGTHTQLRKRVAIKVLNPQLSSPQMLERFHREAITASQIGHEGIAQVTDLGTSRDGEPFLVMEYLEGESLASRLRTTGPLSVEDACELGCAILSPLAAAHRAGIVHRDLKPDNVFVVRQSRGETVKLLDFGISRSAGGDAGFRLTTTGLVLGTPYYMSPEQARGATEVTPAADLYAFGVMLYEMLIGSVPIHGENYNQLMYRVMTGEFARPRERRPDLPEAVEGLILRAMALEPADRPASAGRS